MDIQDFFLDEKSGVLVNPSFQESDLPYLDGSEEYLLKILGQAKDKNSLSWELKKYIKDWPTLYHLTLERANLLRCFDFCNHEAKILELGAGCGAITRYLGEKFATVFAVEGSFPRARVAKKRCSDLKGVSVLCANFLDINFQKEFDIVTLIGVLEYAPLFGRNFTTNPKASAVQFLRFANQALKDKGLLVLAIENKLGLKYFSGAKEDHSGLTFDGIEGYPRKNTAVTFSKFELEGLLRQAGFGEIEFFLPFPDYKLPSVIINAQIPNLRNYWIHNWIETPFPDRTSNKRSLILFNETLAIKEIIEAELLPEFANSFLILAYKGDHEKVDNLLKIDKKWIAKKYSTGRAPHFAKCVVLPSESPLKVCHRKLDPLALSPVPECDLIQNLEEENFIGGDLLTFRILESARRKTFKEEFSLILKEIKNFALDNFGLMIEENGCPLVKGEAFDLVPCNIIVDADDNFHFIDREWVVNKPVRIDYLLFRNVLIVLQRYRAYLPLQNTSDEKFIIEMMQKIFPGYDRQRLIENLREEGYFQNLVLGKLPKTVDKDDAKDDKTKEESNNAYPPPKVSVIIPVFNRLDFTKKCLQSLFYRTNGNIPFEVIVVDNGSSDQTPNFLKEASKIWSSLKVILNSENLGFAKACNQGASIAQGEYLLFLNNDTEVRAGWLDPLVNILDKDPRVGAVGNKLLFPDETIQHAGVIIVDDKRLSDPLLAKLAYYRQPASLPQANQPFCYQAVTAACLLIRKNAFTQVGGFDEEYWNGYEDVDLCFELGEKGWLIVYEPQSVVIHYESQSGPERFSQVGHNIRRLHSKWLGKIMPDFIIEKDGRATNVKGGKIHPYISPVNSLTSIIILTRNNLEYTKMCLESIRRYTPEPREIIVVDNGSTDGTIEYLEAQEDVKLIKNGLNLGFALGNNLGLREARGEYIVILNNDTVVTEGWLTRLINSAQSNPQVGIVGPRSNYVVGVQLVKNVPYGDNMDAMQEFARQWSLENSGRYEEALRVIGFCMLVKREVIEKIGGFDPYYEAGNFEDDDFCIRAQRAGFKIRIAHDVFIHHFGSKTFQSENIDYRQVMLTNWERFKSKWELPRELPIERGYPIYQLIQGGFDQDKHFVPLSIEPLSLEELRSQTYLSEFNTLTLRWFLSNFKPQDDVTLVIYHPEEKAEEEVAKAIQELGYDIDKTPDILLYSHPLPENKIPSLVAAVDKVVVDSDSSPFLIWAKYLNKEVVEIETALHEP